MCGIAGALTLRPGTSHATESVARMSVAVSHRGPDGDGLWFSDDRRVCLAHRRLSIIDLATGQQPMTDPDTGVVIVFNGEIYNYRELRRSLMARGIDFTTQSDTEVLLRLYLFCGPSFLEQLRGMFAFALWDPRSRELLAARDRVGKKPFYYAVVDGCLLFASTFQAIRNELPGPSRVDPARVHDFLALGYVPAPGTIDPRIAKLAAGAVLVAGDDGVHTRSYWDIASAWAPFHGSREDAIDNLDELLNTAVAIRLRSDVPLGVFLSGGIDSSLVAAIAARHATERIQTFSIGFDEQHVDERKHAARVAEYIGAEHHVFSSRVESLELLPELVHHFGEPFGDPSALPIWLLARETRRCVTVAVGGDGGDECFAGYEWYRTGDRLRRLASLSPSALRRLAASALRSTGATFGTLGRLGRATALLASGDAARFAELRSFLDPLLVDRLYAGSVRDAALGERPSGTDLLERAYDDDMVTP